VRLAATLAAAIVVAACAPGPAYFGHSPGEPWGVAVLDDQSFMPLWLDLPAGSTVTWWNQGSSAAVVHSGTPAHPTPLFVFWLPPGSRAAYTFTRPGTFEFFSPGRRNQTGQAIIR
jgi:plastocyanin